MLEDPSHFVSAGDLQSRLQEVQIAASGSRGSIFGPGSITWNINRESALFLAAGRAALLQLAHPWVAAAIAEHSRTLHDPAGRFHQTFRIIFTIVFAPRESVVSAARALHRRHESIQGRLPESTASFVEGSTYQANEVAALRWVYATLIDSALVAYELVLPELTELQREQYYRESRTMAALFGIPRDCLPPDWPAFQRYFETTLQSDTVEVSSIARRLALQLQAGTGLRVRPPNWYNALTIHLLPERLRSQFQLAYGEREWRSAERARRWLRRIYPGLPGALRFVGPYNEAISRLRGELRPGLAVRLSNQLWIGQPSLFDQSRRNQD